MTVHRKSYRPYAGEILPPRRLFWVIAVRELRLAWRKRWVKRLLILSGIPMLFFMAILYVQLVIEQVVRSDILGIEFFENFYGAQVFFVVLMMAALGADIIAKDAASGSLALYFSRPLSRLQYLLGKLLAVGLVLAAIIVVPGLLLALAQLLLAPEQNYGEFAQLAAGIVAYGVVLSACAAAVIACLSAFGKRARYIGVIWVALYFFTAFAAGALWEITDQAAWTQAISIQSLFRDSGRVFYAGGGVVPLLELLALGAATAALVYHRVGKLERSEA